MPPTEAPPSDEKQVVEVPIRKSFRSDSYTEVYTNSSIGAFTPWDIEMTFGKLGSPDGVEELVTVRFAPAHAKAVLKVFESAVRGYEEKYGEVKLAAEQEPKLSAIAAAAKRK